MIVIGTFVGFVKVTLWGALIVPTLTLPKLKFGTLGTRLPVATPVPVMRRLCGELEALSVRTRVAVLVPIALGVKEI